MLVSGRVNSFSFQVFQKNTKKTVKIPSESSKMHFFLAGCGNVMCFMFITLANISFKLGQIHHLTKLILVDSKGGHCSNVP